MIIYKSIYYCTIYIYNIIKAFVLGLVIGAAKILKKVNYFLILLVIELSNQAFYKVNYQSSLKLAKVILVFELG